MLRITVENFSVSDCIILWGSLGINGTYTSSLRKASNSHFSASRSCCFFSSNSVYLVVNISSYTSPLTFIVNRGCDDENDINAILWVYVWVTMQNELNLALSKQLIESCSLENFNHDKIAKGYGADTSKKRGFTSIIESYIRFCRDFGTHPDNVTVSMQKAILASIKSINMRDVMTHLDSENTFMDYDLLAKRRDTNCFGDHTEWLKIMQLLHFDADGVVSTQDIHTHTPTISMVVRTLDDMKLSQSIKLDDIMRLFILTNLNQITARHVTELFCSNLLGRNMAREALVFTSMLADQRFEQHQFTSDFLWLFKHLRIDDAFTKEYNFFKQQKKNIQDVMRQRQIENYDGGRIRLRDRIPKNTHAKWKSNKTCGLQSQQALDSFNGWVARVRFPQITSHKMKHNAYFIVSQTVADEHICRAINRHYEPEVSALVQQHRVVVPETSVICNIIGSLSMHVQPFEELINFRRECFHGFAYKDSHGLTWLQILQLYVSAYQYNPIWTQCWRHVLPILSHQIICDVEKFTANTPYNMDKVVDILVTS